MGQARSRGREHWCGSCTSGPRDARERTLTTDARRGRLEARPGLVREAGPAGLRAVDLRPGRPGLLYVPAAIDAARPLCVALHDRDEEPLAALERVRAAAEDGEVIVLAPAASGRTWDAFEHGLGPDVQRLDAALERVFLDFPVGPRVALAGFGDGASYALALGLANGDFVTDVLAFGPERPLPAPARRGMPRVLVAHARGSGGASVAARRVAGDGLEVTVVPYAEAGAVPAALVCRALRRLADPADPAPGPGPAATRAPSPADFPAAGG